jgi:hypothetical protein
MQGERQRMRLSSTGQEEKGPDPDEPPIVRSSAPPLCWSVRYKRLSAKPPFAFPERRMTHSTSSLNACSVSRTIVPHLPVRRRARVLLMPLTTPVRLCIVHPPMIERSPMCRLLLIPALRAGMRHTRGHTWLHLAPFLSSTQLSS